MPNSTRLQPAHQMPGYTRRHCPVCPNEVDTHRESVDDDRREIVFYHSHLDGIGKPCPMSGKVAALRAVAFTNVGWAVA